MVEDEVTRVRDRRGFQYSLCRVVLMVMCLLRRASPLSTLSVLALSSRFDGRRHSFCPPAAPSLSVLALSSRFDGHQL